MTTGVIEVRLRARGAEPDRLKARAETPLAEEMSHV
jgi:hypothetical protein